MKKISFYKFFVPIALIVLLESCSFEINKHRYSSGWSMHFQSFGKSDNTPVKRMNKRQNQDTINAYNILIEKNLNYQFTDDNKIIDSANREIIRTVFIDSAKFSSVPDTITTNKQFEEDVINYDKAKKQMETISVYTMIVFGLSLISALLAGTIGLGGAGTWVVTLFLISFVLLLVASIYRFVKIFKLLHYFSKDGTPFLDADNPIHEGKLKKRFRILVNALFIVPLVSLFMAIFIRNRIMPQKEEFSSELNAYLREKAGWFILYSVILLLAWGYLFYLVYPYLISTLFII
ncbi:MAG: hypothetical protein J5I91_06270 [Bacteroidetes bacterium]|nr:hypothetical protein [Bacteroidota bacterium]